MEGQRIEGSYVAMNPSMLMEMVHSKKASIEQKNLVVSQQFESVMIKQFLNEALQPMFKGVFNENSEGHRMYRHFFTDAISDSMSKGGGFGISSILQQQLTPAKPSEDNSEATNL